MTQLHRAKARHFHALHHNGSALVLASAWDVAGARQVEQSGGTAVATTGTAWQLGGDSDRSARTRALELIAGVVAAVDVPVTADVENGYASDPTGVADTVRCVLAAGAVGIDISDAGYAMAAPLRPTAEQAERIAAARAAADDVDVPLFVNARIDVFLRTRWPLAELLTATLERAAAYLAAGADGIFVPGVVDPATITELVAGVSAPLSVLAGPDALGFGQLAGLGVARISVLRSGKATGPVQHC
ncbi:MAG TPA: isocitrate lyase/phosphoenolpyruvate mutase family protein [Pseudonocardiaceae bacterium]|nr:isocitrate lyase/phosphoenolpyruvate mutase family protein [Pseudonocardiaceae bacterium]